MKNQSVLGQYIPYQDQLVVTSSDQLTDKEQQQQQQGKSSQQQLTSQIQYLQSYQHQQQQQQLIQDNASPPLFKPEPRLYKKKEEIIYDNDSSSSHFEEDNPNIKQINSGSGGNDDEDDQQLQNKDYKANKLSILNIGKQRSEDLSPLLKKSLLRKRKICGLLEGCDNIESYQKLNKIHEGVYGVVYRALDKLTNEVCAIKKVKIDRVREKEGFPITSIREFNILLALQHPNIVKVKRVVIGKNLDLIYMVMEYMEHELRDLIENQKYSFSQSEVKCLVKQLLEAIEYLHKRNIMHRDLKTSNVLYNNRGQLKVCDFGLGRKFISQNKAYTPTVVTLWYRAPEILLGQDKYTPAIDMWSVGCIFAELILKDQIFKGQSEADQIDIIFKTLGTPTDESWPGWKQLKYGPNFTNKKYAGNKLQEKIPQAGLTEEGFDLLNKMLAMDPRRRISAQQALAHQWFKKGPLPQQLELMPTFPALNEISREERKKNKLNNNQ